MAPLSPRDVTATRSSSAACDGDWSGTVARPRCPPPVSASEAARASFWARLQAAVLPRRERVTRHVHERSEDRRADVVLTKEPEVTVERVERDQERARRRLGPD